MTAAARVGLAAVLLAGIWVCAAEPSGATALYAARESRACDSCHLDPSSWKNPRVADRKCTLSCQSCHVDPAGAGMRNVSGRFLGRSTLPMIATSPRPTRDWDRELLPALRRRDKATTYTDSLPPSPTDFEASRAFAPRDRWAWGHPAGSASRWSMFEGRYGRLRADPLLRVGWDVRLAALLTKGTLAFPMQVDVPVLVHPVEHVSFLVNTGARGRRSGVADALDDASTPYLREAFVLVHELPWLAYAKAGRFVPDFGLRLDDHTAQIRRAFELDGAVPQARVSGVEVGVNPNYPYLRASWFRSTSKLRDPDRFDVFDADEGWGTAVNVGFRELLWGVGASALARRRPLSEGGDATTFGAYAILNPWFWRRDVPLTWQAEGDVGQWTRHSGRTTRQAVFYQELDWSCANGVNLLLAHDWADPDREVADDDLMRFSGGLQLIPIPGVTLDARARLLLPPHASAGSDVFLQLHLWN
jgi:hypothetical protein